VPTPGGGPVIATLGAPVLDPTLGTWRFGGLRLLAWIVVFDVTLPCCSTSRWSPCD